MAYGTMEKIETVTVGSGGTAAITFSNIPSTYNDLLVKLSLRSNESGGTAQSTSFNMSINGVTTNRTFRTIVAYSGTTIASTNGTTAAIGTIPGTSVTASTFNNVEVYLPNYKDSVNKSYFVDSVTENNSATNNELRLTSGLWSQTTAISSLSFASATGNIIEHSTATLYGITRVPAGAKATGGVVYDDASYWYHVFTSSGTFTPSQNLSCDYLVVAGGGGGGGGHNGGGGGAGGLRSTTDATGGGGSLESKITVTSGTDYTVTVGGGGSGGVDTGDVVATAGNNSVFSTITSTGGGRGANGSNVSGKTSSTGGSGGAGGGGSLLANTVGSAGTANQGYAGGNGTGTSGVYEAGGGGGGAGAVGGNGSGASTGGAGGNGVTTSITGSSVAYGGGGGGGSSGAGGTGGGGSSVASGAGNAGTANRGGGGGGSSASGAAGTRNGGNGGSGIVVIRYAK